MRPEPGAKDEPWMAMGIVQVRREQVAGATEQRFFWFGRSSRGVNPWPMTVTFRPWPGPGAQQARAAADVDEVICKITEAWLPKDHTLGNDLGPITLNSEFRKRLELFGRLHSLVDDKALATKPTRASTDAPDKSAGSAPIGRGAKAAAGSAVGNKRCQRKQVPPAKPARATGNQRKEVVPPSTTTNPEGGAVGAKRPRASDPEIRAPATHSQTKQLKVGLPVQAQDARGKWLPGHIVEERGDGKGREVLVHFRGYHKKWDEWLAMDSGKVKPSEGGTSARANQLRRR